MLFLYFIYCYVRFFYDICKIFADSSANEVCFYVFIRASPRLKPIWK